MQNIKNWYEGAKHLISSRNISDGDALDDIVTFLAEGFHVEAEDTDNGFRVTVSISLDERIEYLLTA